MMAVTPVRTGPTPTRSPPTPLTSVAWPTATPDTSLIASSGPGIPSSGMPRACARSGMVCARADTAVKQRITPAQREPSLIGCRRYRTASGANTIKVAAPGVQVVRFGSSLGPGTDLASPDVAARQSVRLEIALVVFIGSVEGRGG